MHSMFKINNQNLEHYGLTLMRIYECFFFFCFLLYYTITVHCRAKTHILKRL